MSFQTLYSIRLAIAILALTAGLVACNDGTESTRDFVKDSTVSLRDTGSEEKEKEHFAKEVEKLARPVYTKAFEEVLDIRSRIKMAEEDTLKKPQVLRYYNQSELAKALNRQPSFGALQKRIMESGDAYVQFKFKQECARIALERSGQAASNDPLKKSN